MHLLCTPTPHLKHKKGEYVATKKGQGSYAAILGTQVQKSFMQK